MTILVNNTNGTSADSLQKTSLVGSPNLRASVSIVHRARFNTLGTSDEYAVIWTANADASGAYCGRQAGETAGRWSMYRSNSIGTTVNECITTGYVADGAWRHFALTYDGTNIRSYINGVLQNTIASTSTIVANTTNTNIGIAWGGRFVLADVAIFSRVLTADELLMLTANRLAPVMGKGDCFGFWPCHFDNMLKDYSGMGNDLSAVAGTGTAPAAYNEGVPVVWRPANPRIILPSAVIIDLGAGLMATRSAGAATQSKAFALTGSGATRSAGLAAMEKSALIIGTGATRAAGSATDTAAASLVGSSLTRSAGSATESKAFALTGAGATRSAGSAEKVVAYSLLGTGTTKAAGAATDTKAAAYIGSSLTRAAGTAAQSRDFSLAGSSATRSAGQATLSVAYSLVGTGATRSAGAAVDAKLAELVASARTISRGNADRVTGGLDGLMTTRSSGHADLTVLASVAGTGASRTAGSATVSSPAGISGQGVTRSAGAATLAKDNSLMASAATRSMQVGILSITASEVAASLTRSSGSATLTVTVSLVGSGETVAAGRATFESASGGGAAGRDDGSAARMRRHVRITGRRRGR